MNVASDVVQLGQPPNGTGGKKNGIEKGDKKCLKQTGTGPQLV